MGFSRVHTVHDILDSNEELLQGHVHVLNVSTARIQ